MAKKNRKISGATQVCVPLMAAFVEVWAFGFLCSGSFYYSDTSEW